MIRLSVNIKTMQQPTKNITRYDELALMSSLINGDTTTSTLLLENGVVDINALGDRPFRNAIWSENIE